MTITAQHAPLPTSAFDQQQPSPALLSLLLSEHRQQQLPRLAQLWDYYRNDLLGPTSLNPNRRYRLAQERGLPTRLTGLPDHHASSEHTALFDTTSHSASSSLSGSSSNREIVIENDIAWRIHTLVDFMFGKPIVIQSTAPDPARAALLESFLRCVLDHNGGLGFLQDMTLLGSVYGYIDILLRVDHASLPNAADPLRSVPCFTLELLEAPRVIPLCHPGDYRKLDAYIIHQRQTLHDLQAQSWWQQIARRFWPSLKSSAAAAQRMQLDRTTVITAGSIHEYAAQIHEQGRGVTTQQPSAERVLLESSLNRLGRIPVIHIQNLPQPFFYPGLSEVEPLIPLQDELNTRLSDRANRITFQSFKMYLGKGIEQFTQRPVRPGQMWATDNLDASIQEFGGDSDNPSEVAHINEIREALDKASGVTALAAGLLRSKVGNLTSENALRIVMMGLLAKTDKKRITYGVGIERICELILHAADVLGILPNTPDERGIRIEWPSPIPENLTQRLQDSLLKLQLGVPQTQVLTELGYADLIANSQPTSS